MYQQSVSPSLNRLLKAFGLPLTIKPHWVVNVAVGSPYIVAWDRVDKIYLLQLADNSLKSPLVKVSELSTLCNIKDAKTCEWLMLHFTVNEMLELMQNIKRRGTLVQL